MKVLLTGASGFVGSHILDRLRARGLPTAVLLRPTSSRRFLEPHLPAVEVRSGSISEPGSLPAALGGITHLIHCAGCTKAARTAEFYAINHAGTRNIIEAANAHSGLKRVVHISSLAAVSPASAERPAREEDLPQPVSHYGRSKLAGEQEVRNHCRAEFVILRPPAVYGPRDVEFLRLFKAVKAHVLPMPGHQPLSMVYVQDLAEAVVSSLEYPATAGKTYFVAAPEVVTARSIASEIAGLMGGWTIPLPLPPVMFWPLCLAGEIRSRLTGKASMLNLQKLSELRAAGWVCDPGLLRRETGYECPTTLKAGIKETLAWYRKNAWL